MRRLLVVLLCATAVASVSGQQARDQVLTQELVVGLAPGQHARLRVAPLLAPDFDARSTLVNVFGDDGQLLATTGRVVLSSGAATPAELTFAHSGADRRLVRFQYQVGGLRRPGAPPAARATTVPGAPGTLEVFDAGAATPALVLPVPAFGTGRAAASCALPSSGPTTALGGRPTAGRLLTGEFPLVAVARGQALQFTLADTLPAGLRRDAALGLIVEVVDAGGQTVIAAPDATLDAPAIHRNVWVVGTELPAPPRDEPTSLRVKYAVTCDGSCSAIGGWLALAQPVGPPFTPGVQVFDAATGGTAFGLVLPAVQTADVDRHDFLVWQSNFGTGGGGGGGGTPPPPPPNS